MDYHLVKYIYITRRVQIYRSLLQHKKYSNNNRPLCDDQTEDTGSASESGNLATAFVYFLVRAGKGNDAARWSGRE